MHRVDVQAPGQTGSVGVDIAETHRATASGMLWAIWLVELGAC